VQSGRGITQAESAALAAAYLTEIVARPFDDPDGVDGEVQRRFFDDLDDYNGLNDSGARDASGGVIPGANRFNIRVTVTASNLLPGVPAADTRLISVSVTDPVGATTTATGLRLRP
jgi:MSHA pilin protein MshD